MEEERKKRIIRKQKRKDQTKGGSDRNLKELGCMTRLGESRRFKGDGARDG